MADSDGHSDGAKVASICEAGIGRHLNAIRFAEFCWEWRVTRMVGLKDRKLSTRTFGLG